MDLNDFLTALRSAPPEIKKDFYEGGREASIKVKTLWQRLHYFVFESWASSYIAGIILLAILYFFIVKPYLNQGGNSNGVTPGFRQKPPKFTPFNNETKPTRDTQVKVLFLKEEVVDGETIKRGIPAYVDDKGRVYVKDENFNDIEVTNMKDNVDWRIQPGIGVLIVPGEEDAKNWLQPALFISPVEFFHVADLDLYVNHRRFGGGACFKLPWSWTRNTYLGGGITVPYKNLVEKNFVISMKINF